MSGVPKVAMVMAAGLGKRMRPLTDHKPKPLVELAGKPMIDHVLDRLRASGVEKAVVNSHYLPHLLEEHLRHVQGIETVISDERDLLMETGGGMVRAAPLIDADPFLAVNSDNFWTDSSTDGLADLASHWRDGAMDALLLLVPHDRAGNHRGRGDFHLESDGRLKRRQGEEIAPYIYTGIQMVSKRLLRDAPDGPFSTNILWDRAIDEGRCFGAVHQGRWFDVGTPEAIPATEEALARG